MLSQHIFHIIAVGRNKDSFIEKGMEEYTRNIKKYCEMRWHICKEASETDRARKIIREADNINAVLKQIKSPVIITLSEGKNCETSFDIAQKLINWMNKSLNLVFIIGGAYGLSEEISLKSHFKFSLSTLTFNHQLVRLILAEQIYRLLSIIYKSTYHH